MPGEADHEVDRHRAGAADHGEEHRVDDAARQARNLEQVFEVRKRQLLEEVDALAPGIDEGAQRDAADRQDDRDEEPEADDRKRDDLTLGAELASSGCAPPCHRARHSGGHAAAAGAGTRRAAA